MMVEQMTTLGLLGRVMVSIMRRSPRMSSRMASQSVLEYCACSHARTFLSFSFGIRFVQSSPYSSAHTRGRQLRRVC